MKTVMMKVKNLYMTYIVFDVPAQAMFLHSNLNFPAFFGYVEKKKSMKNT